MLTRRHFVVGSSSRALAMVVSLCMVLVAITLALLDNASAVASPASAGNTYVVNSTADAPDADQGDGLCASAVNGCTLRAAIMQANFTTGPNTITVPAGVYLLTRPGYDDAAVLGDLDISDDLTIQGVGSSLTTVDGNGAVTGDRVFQVMDGALSVSLSGMTIRNGTVPTTGVGGPSRGGGIRVDPLNSFITLHLDDVTLEGNSALNGGGLYASASTVDLKNTTVRVNTTLDIGGTGGGIYAAFGSALTIRDSRVYSNSAYGGGGLALEGVLRADIDRTEFYSNTAGNYGGGIHSTVTFDYPVSPLTLVDSSLHDNFAAVEGGAIASYGSTLVLSRTVLDANRAFYYGGGVWTKPSLAAAMSFQESTLSRNTAQFGGAIYNDDLVGRATELVNSTLSGNVASHDGGGIYAGGGAKFRLWNTTIAGNLLSRGRFQVGPLRGGGIFITGTAVITAQNTLIADNLYTDNLTKVVPDDCFGSLVSLGNNLIETTTNCMLSGTTFGNVTGQDPKLGPLQNNGGPSTGSGQASAQTRALLPGSPAIDAGNPSGCTNGNNQLLTIDQRGWRRPIGARCDIGAFEYSPFALDLPLVSR